jgi:hypothetical protein
MLSIEIRSSIQSIIMLIVTIKHTMQSVAIKSIMLSVEIKSSILSIVMLIVAIKHIKHLAFNTKNNIRTY